MMLLAMALSAATVSASQPTKDPYSGGFDDPSPSPASVPISSDGPDTPPSWSRVRAATEAAIRQRLVDPDSAKIEWPNGFRWGVYKPPFQKRLDRWVTCGNVNARNRMGGYVGDHAFIVVYANGGVERLDMDSGTDRLALVNVICGKSTFPPPQAELMAQRAATSGAAPPSVADELQKLADLRDRGVLTETEFEAQKAKVLGAR